MTIKPNKRVHKNDIFNEMKNYSLQFFEVMYAVYHNLQQWFNQSKIAGKGLFQYHIDSSVHGFEYFGNLKHVQVCSGTFVTKIPSYVSRKLLVPSVL